MTKTNLADIVARARAVLREWDGEKSAPNELADAVLELLGPLRLAAEDLSADALRKLVQIEKVLGRLADPDFTAEDWETLDMLMLGLWIRVDNAFTRLPSR